MVELQDMTARGQLRARINDELVLDAGTCEEVSGPHGPEQIIRPPGITRDGGDLPGLRCCRGVQR